MPAVTDSERTQTVLGPKPVHHSESPRRACREGFLEEVASADDGEGAVQRVFPAEAPG